MTTFPNSPRLLKGGIVLINAETSAVQRIIALQYNPDTLSRTLQMKGVGGEGGDHSQASHLKGALAEPIRPEVTTDVTDQHQKATGHAMGFRT